MEPVSIIALSVFVVMLEQGRYEDCSTKVIHTFSTQNAAESYIIAKTAELNRVIGLRDAAYVLLNDWREAHKPLYETTSQNIPDFSHDFHEEESKELARIYKALKIDDAFNGIGVDEYECDTALYTMVESKLD